LHDIPIEAVSLPPAQLQDLYAIGVRTLGDCTRLPRDGLGRRFRPEFLRQLDQIYGRQPDPRIYFEPPKAFTSRLDLPWEVRHTQALHAAMMRLLYELTAYLRAQAVTTRQLRWTLHQTDRACSHHVLGLGAPSRDIERLSVLTRERFHREVLSAPVRALELTVTTLEPDVAPAISSLFQSRKVATTEDWPQFTARLRARLGDDVLHGLAVCLDHRPEHATARSKWPADKLRSRSQPETQAQENPRPLWLTRRPIPLHECGGRLEWRGGLVVNHTRERIESGWWDGESVARDYFVATDPCGTRWWVYKELTGRRGWYLHGIFD
ncbi:MAG: Y-family DNA polymerase, partial [Gammaproteobacteria bacterium]